MGTIWVAEHLVLQCPVAVKLIDRDAVFDGETSARFLREAKAAATLRSAHVVQILDYGVDEGVSFIVMELLEGENLAQRLRRTKRLGPAETALIITHIGRAIARAHEAGIVHRDLKPENVFLVSNEDEEVAKVLDFGVAKIAHGELKEGTRTRTGSILGTPYYMSPEQAQGNKAVDYRSDLWSLGVIAFECFTGERPFFSDGLGDLVLQICVRDLPVPSSVASVPLGFDEWFLRAVAREPEQRFQSAREMTEALREVLGLDLREPRSALPEVVVSSSEGAAGLGGTARVADPGTATLALNPEVVKRLAQAVADDAEQEGSWSTRPGLRPADSIQSVAEGMNTSSPDQILAPPASSTTGIGTLAAVAIVALLLGLGAGLVLLWQPRARLLQAPLSLPANSASSETDLGRASERASKQPEFSRRTDSVSAGTEDGLLWGSAVPSNRPSSAPPPPASPPPRVAEERVPISVDAGGPPIASSDAGWVKPAWAIPDEEPHKAPDWMQEEEP